MFETPLLDICSSTDCQGFKHCNSLQTQLSLKLQYIKSRRVHIYEVYTINFQTFFVWAFKFFVDSGKFSMLLLYILLDDWPIFMILGSNEQLRQQLEYTQLKPDWYNWWISKMQSWLLLEHMAWIEHQFLRGISESVRDDESCGKNKEVNKPELIGQRVRFGLGLLCWGFEGVQEEIHREEANTLQIGSVAFPPGQYTTPELHPCHILFDQDGHQYSSSASL